MRYASEYKSCSESACLHVSTAVLSSGYLRRSNSLQTSYEVTHIIRVPGI